MCGIAGWIAKPGAHLGESAMEAMLHAMAHRGPDGQGVRAFRDAATGRSVVLGHRRLAIIDPNGAAQPMCDNVAQVALSFNGEIYNFRQLRAELAPHGYRFCRDSDTEVLLRAYQHWGCELVHHLRGQFAFAIWDGRAGRLLLARDRYGEKPLFLAETAEGLVFASEIKALLKMPGFQPEVNLAAVSEYLSYRYVPGPKTLFAGVRKLLPGTLAVWERGKLSERRYWSAPDARPQKITGADASPEGLVAGFTERMEEAVKLQMVSDVPFGAFLSGGLDSSTVVALMSRHNAKVKTFSVGFGDERYSELSYAAEVAQAFSTDHHELRANPEDLMALLPRLVAYRDAPVSEPSDIPIYMLAREASKSVKMVLTGEGSDEILGGYPKHVAERFRGGFQFLPACLRRGLLEPLVHALPYGFRRIKTAIATLGIDDPRERYVRWFGALNAAERRELSILKNENLEGEIPPQFNTEASNSRLRNILYFDQTSWLPDNLLERGDRMTMAASIEARVPFLDHRLAEYVSTLPDDCRVRGTKTKWILREAGRKLIPERILKRPKVGFRVPVNEWFRGPMREYLCDHLLGAGSRTRKYYDPGTLDRLVNEHLQGRQNREKLLWTLLNLELWHREYAPA
jgi:asparagine synthase (glutamine-hydrolysing)